MGTIVVGVDGSAASRRALDSAVEEAMLRGWDVQAIHARLRIVCRGQPGRVLVGASYRADLVVVGARGRGAASRLLVGSTSSAVVHRAACPVLVVRG